MIRPRDSLPSLAPAPSRDFPALRRVLPFTLPYRMHMAGAVLALLVSSAAVLGLGQGLRRLVDEGFKSGDVATLGIVILLAFGSIALVLWIGGRDVLAGRISAGDLSAFVFYAVVVAMAIGTLSEVWGDVQRAAGAAAAITLNPAVG